MHAHVHDLLMRMGEIARRTGLSRNTVRKYLADDTVEPYYPPRISRANSMAMPSNYKAGLKSNCAKAVKKRRHEKQLYRDLIELGYTRSYDRVAAYARQWREAQQTS